MKTPNYCGSPQCGDTSTRNVANIMNLVQQIVLGLRTKLQAIYALNCKFRPLRTQLQSLSSTTKLQITIIQP